MSSRVSLTFDDGPDPEWTPAVLAALARAQVQATFFVVAEQLLEPGGIDLLGQLLAAGHQVEAHCARHRPHDEQSASELRADVDELLGVLGAGAAPRPALWRPPYGRLNRPASFAVAREVGLELVLWTCDPRDYRNTPPEEMLEQVGEALYEDSVILLHDSRRYAHGADSAANTVALIEPLVSLVRERGFSLGPLEAPVAARPRRVGEDTDLVPVAG